MSLTSSPDRVVVSESVARALTDGAPVVALESTIITHGLPHPENVRAALDFEQTVLDSGAIPATIAVIDGVAHIGIGSEQVERLAGAESALKLSARDLPVAMARGVSGGTTVAATALLAARAGIRVFATGGIGGVHRNASETFDESADLGILGSCPITVVSAGVKSILDIRATLERLETLSVTVLVYGTQQFPAFWLADSGITVDFAVSSGEEVAAVMRAADALGRPGGILVANPLPASAQLDREVHDRLLAEALTAAEAAAVSGKEITPFLLDYIHSHTAGTSVTSTWRSSAATAGWRRPSPRPTPGLRADQAAAGSGVLGDPKAMGGDVGEAPGALRNEPSDESIDAFGRHVVIEPPLRLPGNR